MHRLSWFLIPLSYLVFILPSETIFTNLKAGLGLFSLFVIPGYLLSTYLQEDVSKDRDLAEKLIIYLAYSLCLLFIPWAAVFFVGLPLTTVFWGICGLNIAGSLMMPLVNRASAQGAHQGDAEFIFSWGPVPYVVFTVLCVLSVLLFGAQLTGDAESYRAWTRNIYSGDIAPMENTEAGWEGYVGFKYRHSFLFLSYAAISKAMGADPDGVWVVVPAFFTMFVLVLNYCWAKSIFKNQHVAYIALVLTPFIYGRVLPQMVGPNVLSSFVLMPLATLMALWYLLSDKRETNFLWAICATLIAVFMAVEHTQHFIYFLLIVGTFALLRFLMQRKITSTVWKVSQIVLVSMILSLPYILWMYFLASQQYDPGQATVRHFSRGPYFVGSTGFFIVNPRLLLSKNAGLLLTLWVIIGLFALSDRRRWGTVAGTFLLATLVPIVLVGLNPLLAPILSRLIAPQVVYRLGGIIPVSVMAAFSIVRVTEHLSSLWDGTRIRLGKSSHRRVALLALALGCLALPAFGLHILRMGFDMTEAKTRQVFFSPRGANPNWLDNKLRLVIENRLVDDPYYLLLEPVQFALFLDRSILEFVRNEIPSDSVFFSEHVVEAMLPAYADQLAFRGRRILSSPLDRLGDDNLPPAAQERRDAATTILDPATSSSRIATLLTRYRDEIDYLLITPKIAFLRQKLDRIDFIENIYDENSLAVYKVQQENP